MYCVIPAIYILSFLGLFSVLFLDGMNRKAERNLETSLIGALVGIALSTTIVIGIAILSNQK